MFNAWLIESVAHYPGASTAYYCADGDWCSNANHAHKFDTREMAETKAATMVCPVRVAEHGWYQ